MVDSGEELPAEVVDRIKRQLQGGEPVPEWLKTAVSRQ